MSEAAKLFDIRGKTALVTGGAGLLGAQFCRTLAEAGASVVIADLEFEKAKKLSHDFLEKGLSARAVRLDVTLPGSVSAAVDETLTVFGSLDILVNSAALDPKFDPDSLARQANPGQSSDSQAVNPADLSNGSFENFPLEAWNKALQVNLTGVFLCCQAAVKPMLAKGSGVIVNLSSIYGMVAPDQRLYQRPGKPMFKPAYYSVTKAGILGLTRYLAAYYGGSGIRVNALTPGGVFNHHDQDFVEAYSSRSVIGRMANVDELNGSLLFLVSDASTYMTGANLVVDGGWTAW